MPGDAFSIGLRYGYRLVVTAAALLIVYAVQDALREGEPNPTAWTLLVVVDALMVVTAVAAWSRHSIAVAVQVLVIPILAALYLFEARQRDRVAEMFHIDEYGTSFEPKLQRRGASHHSTFTEHPADGTLNKKNGLRPSGQGLSQWGSNGSDSDDEQAEPGDRGVPVVFDEGRGSVGLLIHTRVMEREIQPLGVSDRN